MRNIVPLYFCIFIQNLMPESTMQRWKIVLLLANDLLGEPTTHGVIYSKRRWKNVESDNICIIVLEGYKISPEVYWPRACIGVGFIHTKLWIWSQEKNIEYMFNRRKQQAIILKTNLNSVVFMHFIFYPYFGPKIL